MPCGHSINDYMSASAAALGKMRGPTLLVPEQGTHLGLLITNRPRSTVQRTLVELHALPEALSPFVERAERAAWCSQCGARSGPR